jgi:GMP synthase (glutamine-hydrolysing)
MRIHLLQHVAFEGLGSIEEWARANDAVISTSRLFADEALPPMDEFDWLVVMGGPMNIYQEESYPWLRGEKACIAEAIKGGKVVLGVCLGAQLIADCLGAKVTRNRQREIGWFPLTRVHPAMEAIIPTGSLVMHWHGDTFALPSGAELLASSEACDNQGFIHQGRVVGLQFHLETTAESLASLIAAGSDDLSPAGPYIQTAHEMQADAGRFPAINRMMAALLNRLRDQGEINTAR